MNHRDPDIVTASEFTLGLVGLLLVVLTMRTRVTRGLGPGKTVALDDVTLFSERLKLVGRPDRIVRQGEHLIPEEWKPTAKRLYPGHRLLGAYFLLVEEEYGVRPPFGIVAGVGDEGRDSQAGRSFNQFSAHRSLPVTATTGQKPRQGTLLDAAGPRREGPPSRRTGPMAIHSDSRRRG